MQVFSIRYSVFGVKYGFLTTHVNSSDKDIGQGELAHKLELTTDHSQLTTHGGRGLEDKHHRDIIHKGNNSTSDEVLTHNSQELTTHRIHAHRSRIAATPMPPPVQIEINPRPRPF